MGDRRAGCRVKAVMAATLAAVTISPATFGATTRQETTPALKTVWDGVYTDVQSRRGQQFSQASCVSCHGDELAGSDLAPALQGDDFKSAWSGRTAAELYEKIHATMPADRVGMLKPQSADLVAYIFKLNDFPAGAPELGPDTAALSAIRIRSTR